MFLKIGSIDFEVEFKANFKTFQNTLKAFI